MCVTDVQAATATSSGQRSLASVGLLDDPAILLVDSRLLVWVERSTRRSSRTSLVASTAAARAPQGRLKSPRFKSGLYTKFRDHGFLLTLERACEAQIWKGILRFRGVKSSNFFWPAGAAPQGRRGRGASRPARPRNVIPKNQPDSLKIGGNRENRENQLRTPKWAYSRERDNPCPSLHCPVRRRVVLSRRDPAAGAATGSRGAPAPASGRVLHASS